MDDNTVETIAMTSGTEGGVLHLLRLTRTQCHAWVAFVALRTEDGAIDITAVPGADDESSEWTPETLQGIVAQTLEDPLIGEGRAVIRVSEVFRRYWPGERQYTRMAVAPLNDVSEPGRPWGLLCALDPVDGQFSETQLDMLGRLAVRFTNHLRVRRQFMADVAASDALLSEVIEREASQETTPAPAQVSSAEVAAEVSWHNLSGSLSTGLAGGTGIEAVGREPNAPDVEVVFGQAFSVDDPAPVASQVIPERAAPEEATLAPDEAAPEEAPLAPEEAAPEEAPERAPQAGGPAVGKVRLSELIEQLDVTLHRLRAAKRRGALFLVELSSGLVLSEVETKGAGDRLAEATRHGDVVFGVGSDMLAVVMELGTRPVDLEAVRDRLTRAAAGPSSESRPLRSTVLSLDPEQPSTGESLVLGAVRKLGTP